MNEAEFMASSDPHAMLTYLQSSRAIRGITQPPPPFPSDRKMRLFACAFARSSKMINDPTEVDFLPAIERAEKAADAGVDHDPSVRRKFVDGKH